MFKKITLVVIVSIIGTASYFILRNNFRTSDDTILDGIRRSLINERENPSTYIKEKIHYRERLLHKGYQIYFVIKNESRFTEYYNLRYEIMHNSPTTIIKRDTITIYKRIEPNQQIDISEYLENEYKQTKELKIKFIDTQKVQY